jgi:uncharacterized membrane protein YjdF
LEPGADFPPGFASFIRAAHGNKAYMIYAIFMLLVLLTLFAAWRRHVLELPLFAVTVLWVLIHLVGDMTTPLTLSF